MPNLNLHTNAGGNTGTTVGIRGSITGDRDFDEWKIVWVGGMWFQDLWTYDFRRTEM